MEAPKTKGKRGTTYCSALNCTSNKFDNKDLSFFRFPKDVNRLVVVKSADFSYTPSERHVHNTERNKKISVRIKDI